MKREVTGLLSAKEARELFEREAVIYSGPAGAVPLYRIPELFGEEIADWLIENRRDFKDRGKAMFHIGPGDLWLSCVFMDGFYELVGRHNKQLLYGAHKSSKGGQYIERAWEKR